MRQNVKPVTSYLQGSAALISFLLRLIRRVYFYNMDASFCCFEIHTVCPLCPYVSGLFPYPLPSIPNLLGQKGQLNLKKTKDFTWKYKKLIVSWLSRRALEISGQA